MLKGDFEMSSRSLHWLDSQEDQKPAPSKWWSFCQSKYISSVIVVFGVTLILSSILVNEQVAKMSPLFDRATAPSEVRLQTEGSPANGTDGCDLSRNSTGNLASKSTEDVTREPDNRQLAAGKDIPPGMVVATTDLQMRSLTQQDEQGIKKAMTKNLLAMAVGIKQKNVVDKIVQKFPLKNFTIMLFHYDGIVDQWRDLAWSNHSIHVVALRQTKWWYAKRFMHPDIVDQFDYIFLWDEDLGVEHFQADRYLEIMKAEGLEISQPALDPGSLEIHHSITRRNPRLTLHKSIVTKSCPPKNKAIPCTGYVEVMAPVFTRAAWQCVWRMIQNDLVHGWGIDYKIGYCAQGSRSEKVGVIDAEYILHKGIPSLGGPHVNNTLLAPNASTFANGSVGVYDARKEVRKKSSKEMLAFQKRWAKAVRDDPTWKDPYKAYAEAEVYHSSRAAASAVP